MPTNPSSVASPMDVEATVRTLAGVVKVYRSAIEADEARGYSPFQRQIDTVATLTRLVAFLTDELGGLRQDAERWRMWARHLPPAEEISLGAKCSRYTVTLWGDMTIPAALTPEEWRNGGPAEAPGIMRDVQAALLVFGVRVTAQDDDSTDVIGCDSHALAALCLYQQPFGFTQEDVDVLRMFASPPGLPPYAPLLNLAARIAALLPPSPDQSR